MIRLLTSGDWSWIVTSREQNLLTGKFAFTTLLAVERATRRQ